MARHAKKIDTVHWTTGDFRSAAQAADGSVGLTVLGAQHLPETLLRIRGSYSVDMDGALAAGSGIQVALGLILVPEGTGGTVLWSPTTDGDAPWIWWDTVSLLYDEAVADVIGTQNVLCAMREIDSKAMRKVRNTELQFVAETATIAGFTARSVNIAGQVRVLAGS